MLPLLFTALCTFGFSAIVLAEDYTIKSLAVTPCTFKLQVTPADDFSYIDIVYSTKGVTPNNLLSHGSGHSKNERRCYSSAIISHPNRSARARPLRMELSGTIELDAGLAAKVETGLVWGYAMAMVSFASIMPSYLVDCFSCNGTDKLYGCNCPRPHEWVLKIFP